LLNQQTEGINFKCKERGKRDAGNKIRNPFDTEDHDVM
jgi:hypothetical protein